jgi:hypothetical protein
MQRFSLFFVQGWYINLVTWQKELVRTSLELYAREERMQSYFEDYSFVVFPIAKAYEGYLKQLLYDFGFINLLTFHDKRFRIGRALNPDLNPAHQDDQWLFPRLAESCSKETARFLWDAWLECRNQVFHYFPDNEKRLSLIEAGKCIEMLAQAMDLAYQCKIQDKAKV